VSEIYTESVTTDGVLDRSLPLDLPTPRDEGKRPPLTAEDSEDPFDGLAPSLRSALVRRGFTEFTAVQQAVVDADSRGRNLRISSQTGSGKTVALGLAVAEDLLDKDTLKSAKAGPVVLVVTPTRELAAQVCEELGWLFEEADGVHATSVTGGTDPGQERRALAGRPAILVGTPGRLLDHARQGALKLSSIRHAVLDEADRMLDMGFREDLEELSSQLPEAAHRHLISATFPPGVRRFADAFQPDPLHLEGTRLGVANQDITHIAHLVRRNERYAALVNLLLLAPQERCIIFVRKRTHAAEIAERLGADSFLVLPFSGDLAQAQRNRTLSAFRHGTIGTLVATDVAARGIDVADIATVIHLDLDIDADVYTHRSGRTGRAGRPGRSILLVPEENERRVYSLLRSARVEASWSPLPTAARVRKALSKRLRTTLHERLENSAQAPTPAELEYAQGLLENRDPATVVAHLLALATPALPREPMETTPIEPRATRERSNERRPVESASRASAPEGVARSGAERTPRPSGGEGRPTATPRRRDRGRDGDRGRDSDGSTPPRPKRKREPRAHE